MDESFSQWVEDLDLDELDERKVIFFDIVPPQINKFYVFDFSPEKSLFKYLVEQGQQLFAVGWRNPTAQRSDLELCGEQLLAG